MKSRIVLLLLALFMLSIPSFAAAENGVDTPQMTQQQETNAHAHYGYVAAGIGMAIASGLCGLAQARAVAASVEGMARNPAASAAIRFALILGLVLIESLALYTLVIILLKVNV